jgi:hypothetical protein
MRDAPVPGRVEPEEARLQDLQRVPVGHQEDVAARVPPFQVGDERGRPVEHGGGRLDVAVGAAGARLVGCPHPRVVGRRRPVQVAEGPLAQGAGDDDRWRAEVRPHDLRRLPRAGEVRGADHRLRGQAGAFRRRERLPPAEL